MYVEPAPDVSGLSIVAAAKYVLTPAPERKKPTGYPHWDKIRHLKPPKGLTHEEWWAAIKLGRISQQRPLPLRDTEGRGFTYALTDEVFRLLHFVDQRTSGEIAMAEVVTADEQARQHYMVNSLMEEAIRSSQLEGASTSRRVAKELLRSGREPQDRGERMILNNYRALQFMRSLEGPLTPEAVLELHRILTDGTLHAPPPAEELPARLQALCDFANEDPDTAAQFIHPVVRAVVLHFWVGYDHPFEDGNGRTARALFYWYMRVRGYWLVEYLTISRILRNAPSQYSRAFVYSETDGGDMTYFLLYQLEVIERAVDELHRYLGRKMAEVRSVEKLIKGSTRFNHRQLALLSDAVRDQNRVYTMGSHAASHNVTHETARTDLTDLADRGLLAKRRAGRRYAFGPPPDLTDRLKALD